MLIDRWEANTPMLVDIAMFLPPKAPRQLLAILALVLAVSVSNPTQILGQSDPRSPTDPSDPVKLLVDKLNDPKAGAALRAQWNIDRAIWTEPVTAVKNGTTVLVTPAH